MLHIIVATGQDAFRVLVPVLVRGLVTRPEGSLGLELQCSSSRLCPSQSTRPRPMPVRTVSPVPIISMTQRSGPRSEPLEHVTETFAPSHWDEMPTVRWALSSV
jgi:hypothetical protein